MRNIDKLSAPLAGPQPDAVLGLFTEPSMLGAIAGTIGTKRIAALHSSTSARHREHDTIIAPLHESFPLLRAVAAKFDLVVAQPPAGQQWSAAGLPVPKRAGATRALALDGGTIDSTIATWLVANELLTPAGEGVIVAQAASLRAAVSGCTLASRVWLWLELPGGLLAAYFGARHRDVCGTAPTLKEFDSAKARLRGERVKRNTATRNSLDRFGMARAEHLRLHSARPSPHVALDTDGCFACHTTGFDRVSGRVPTELADALEQIHRKHPLNFVQQQAALRELRQTLGSPSLRVAPGVLDAVNTAENEHQMASTPFMRPTNAQAVAWLDGEEGVRCSAPFYSFRKGETYAVTSQMFTGVKIEKRRQPDGSMEDVEVSGMEMAVVVQDALGAKHAFTQHTMSDDSKAQLQVKEAHPLSDLLSHFAMPEVPDVAERDPVRFAQLVARLRKLERAKPADPIDAALSDLDAI